MNYQETLDYLFSQLPMYQRIGAAAYKADLNTTWQLLEALGNPQNHPARYIHVAGTNGKGSVSHMIASVLQEAGFKTGLFTSPHLKDFRERIKINGQMISEDDVISFVNHHQSAFEKVEPSFFEMTAALAFTYFKNQNADFVVLETGMGGRLDSTNVISPEISVITNIGLDHTRFLGDTITAIAGEKAGIIKAHRPVVAGTMLPQALQVIREKAKILNAPLFNASHFKHPFTTDLKGIYQKENLQTAVAAIRQLQSAGHTIDEQTISRGLLHVVKNTGLLGRWQTLSTDPLVICDVGHNTDGLRYVVEQITSTPHKQLHMVLGMANDKAVDELLVLLPQNARYYFCAAKIPRAFIASELHRLAEQAGLNGLPFPSVADAFKAACDAAKNDDLVFVGGSVFVVAEVL